MTEKKKEIWMPIKGYEGLYEVSSLGRIKTVRRKTKTSNRTVPEIIRKPNVMKGYHCVALRKDGKVKVYRIHRLVAETFIGSAPSEEYQINHIDGNKANNSVDNLEWVTPKENTHHAFESGLRPKVLQEETKRKIGNKTRQSWQNEDYRNNQSKKAKEIWSDPIKHAERATAIKEGIRRAKENGTYRR